VAVLGLRGLGRRLVIFAACGSRVAVVRSEYAQSVGANSVAKSDRAQFKVSPRNPPRGLLGANLPACGRRAAREGEVSPAFGSAGWPRWCGAGLEVRDRSVLVTFLPELERAAKCALIHSRFPGTFPRFEPSRNRGSCFIGLVVATAFSTPWVSRSRFERPLIHSCVGLYGTQRAREGASGELAVAKLSDALKAFADRDPRSAELGTLSTSQ
jgi:hypothetical protein